MFRHALAAAAVVMAVALAACTPPQMAQREQVVSATGTVTAIDRETRRVVIQEPNRTVQYRIGSQVTNFDQVEVGDQVRLDYIESVAVAMADPADTGEPIVDIFGVRAPEGSRPGMAAGSVATVVVELVSYDARSSRATIRTPSGEVRTVSVAPELRRFASTRSPGDRILVLIEQAVAVSVTPVG